MSRRFTLLDPEYFDALIQVTSAFEREALPIALVGGGAAQAWIASLRTGDGADRMQDQPALRSALRPTRDLDFATRTDPARALHIFNELAASVGSAHVLGPRALRLGSVSVALTLEPSDLSGMSSLYDAFLDDRTEVELRHGAKPERVPLIAIAHLFVTKITRRGDKAKDLVDIAELLAAHETAGREVDLAVVRRLVHDRPDALGLLDEIEASMRARGAAP